MHKILTFIALAFLFQQVQAQDSNLKPITERVNVQVDTARISQIIDDEWVAVGTKKKHAICYDHSLLFDGKPSFRFELKEDDNTLSGYSAGETKGRAELSYCYATSKDFAGLPSETYLNAQKMKTVYHYGKGISKQGSSRKYTFSVYIPSTLRSDVTTIFAQWHGMPDRTLVSTPEGIVKKLTDAEFADLYDRMIFKKNIAHDKIKVTDKKGNITYKAGKANGWLVEQGGYPPLAFGFAKGYFYIKANSDRKWLTDKADRCNADVEKVGIMQSVTSDYKASTIAYKSSFDEFPKDCWITFTIDVKWTEYGGESEEIMKPGKLDVKMSYGKGNKPISKHIVKNETILIGRNDDDGYYFKFGIYRVGNSTTPVCYNLAGYSEEELK
ncbi:heparin lyase [Dysgonomonas sp. PFB1-18]|uniref:heparin lyase I family protein n=1 Tax=unclassified Dysgonomonas TaxID=2630389 RepID=UPI002473FA84|nr:MULTISPECIES: heparin lyase I family protein [unclassified Dysgonomonas]MDH6308911.1 heparin lyase [Dysgonomonas sp. PF1-14]MDH6338662.1 heparin lyase [Dysgonomonas sp. PF1-16]MDH6380310.1 heparin lyase [Dysgonomonas sp. PFB1-18]MDH6397640.1 heparin lyase [Dysgonomonas sp. PF1-23]